MSELKFRFVDTGDGTVYKPITLVELLRRIEIPRRIVLESENGDWVDTNDFLDAFENGEIIAEQYTGLNDKNGKEIYEGDITEGEYNFRKSRCAVRFALDDEVGSCGCCYDSFSGSGFIVTNKTIPPERLEAIGNIHENPELLEEK